MNTTAPASILSRDDWEKIVIALQHYVINTETTLIEKNAGEREWTELSQFETLIKDINLYILAV